MKKIYILVMVLLVYAASAFAADTSASEYLTGNETDVAATGEYEGFRKILNHKYVGEYDIYFKVNSDGTNGSSTSYETPIVYIGNHNMNELMTFILDGNGYTATRAQWYQMLSDVEKNDKNNMLRRIVGEQFYKEYFAHRYGEYESQRIAKEYVEDKILKVEKVDRFSTADIKIVSEKPKKKIFGLF